MKYFMLFYIYTTNCHMFMVFMQSNTWQNMLITNWQISSDKVYYLGSELETYKKLILQGT